MHKYNSNWNQLDGGREGLWDYELWKYVLTVSLEHNGEGFYDENSEFYTKLEKKYPNEKWKSKDSTDNFRPLFRDYSHPSFSTVVIDPPWNERGGGRIKRGADRHYPLMKTPDIIRTVLQCPRWNQLAASAHLYLWVTNNFLQDGLRVIDALGFRYVTNFVWVKDRIGLGQYFRGRHELCLFSTRGSPTEPRSARRDLSSVVEAPRHAHSAKPDKAAELIEARSRGPYLELFARRRRSGWTCWGDEVARLGELLTGKREDPHND